ncbi:MAG: hypothetical protein Q8P50_00465 [Bacillota bacterium]|nr:hypothetical protein [Bacillota bacterium]
MASTVKCPFCGHVFEEVDATGGCRGCPMAGSCAKTKCPNCGYEVLKEPGLLTQLPHSSGVFHRF